MIHPTHAGEFVAAHKFEYFQVSLDFLPEMKLLY
jgi:hypothetical protein